MVPFSFCNEDMRLLTGKAVAGRALYWPREQALLVADLHLEKASFFARHGQMLPPYDTRETLERIALAVRETGARRVFALGDNFHDGGGPERIEPHAAGMLSALVRALDWVWITGNHDAGTDGEAFVRIAGGTGLDECEVGGIALRHKAVAHAPGPEISGHFHPRIAVAVRGRRVVRPCAVHGGSRLILPAFGALTGGMDAADPAIVAALQPAEQIDAVLPATGRLVQYPLWRNAA